MIEAIFRQVFQGLHQGTVVFLGLLCFLAFMINAGLLFYALTRRGTHGLARCPRCGRSIVCPHCIEEVDDENNAAS